MKNPSREFLRKKRKRRINIIGSKKTPRLSIFRSNRRMYLQLVDDENGKVLGGVLSKDSMDSKNKINKISAAFACGAEIGKLARKLKITRAIFDRGGYRFHGRIKAVSEGAQKEGLNFKKK